MLQTFFLTFLISTGSFQGAEPLVTTPTTTSLTFNNTMGIIGGEELIGSLWVMGTCQLDKLNVKITQFNGGHIKTTADSQFILDNYNLWTTSQPPRIHVSLDIESTGPLGIYAGDASFLKAIQRQREIFEKQGEPLIPPPIYDKRTVVLTTVCHEYHGSLYKENHAVVISANPQSISNFEKLMKKYHPAPTRTEFQKKVFCKLMMNKFKQSRSKLSTV